MRDELKRLAILAVLVAALWAAPLRSHAFFAALGSSISLLQEYARLHIVTSLLPALLLAGAIASLLRGSTIMKRLVTPGFAAYAVASVSGAVLAVCSCTVLPMFAGIYSAGAGIGPASTFLFAGPAINILAFVMSTRILGPGLGFARVVCAVVLSIAIGLAMNLLFGGSDRSRPERTAAVLPEGGLPARRALPVMAAVACVMIFARSGCPCEENLAFVPAFASWGIVAACAAALSVMLVAWFEVRWWKPLLAAVPVLALSILIPSDPKPAFLAGLVGFSVILARGGGLLREWFDETLGLATKVIPLLLGGVAVTGFLLGTSDAPGLIPYRWLESAVSGDSPLTVLAASVAGAFMYFATLTEVPIVQGLMRSGMGSASALAILLSGPSLSLPSILVVRSVMGTRRTLAFVLLVIIFSAASGLLYGAVFAD